MKLKSIAVAVLSSGLMFGATATAIAAPPQNTDTPKSSADRNTTAKIRKAIVDDKTLSSSAKNVKIIVADGKVTLRGQVKSDAEKKTIADKASEVVGAANVTNELTVEPSK